jgi:hypothetical protein
LAAFFALAGTAELLGAWSDCAGAVKGVAKAQTAKAKARRGK